MREAMRLFQIPLWNTYSFFMTYAELDGFDPRDERFAVKKEENEVLDLWILTRLQGLIQGVRDAMEAFEVHQAVRQFREFMDGLSNFWLRASRRRFWEKEYTKSKKAAYHTLYQVLVTLSKLLAPFMPFFAEHLYQTLVVPIAENPKDGFPLSVHLETYPEPDENWRDLKLEEQVGHVESLIVEGRSIRARTNLKIRQPLPNAVVVAKNEVLEQLKPFTNLILNELNLKNIEYTTDPGKVLERKLKPHFDKLDPKFRKEANKVGNHLKNLSDEQVEPLLKQLEEKGVATLVIDDKEYEISSDDVEVLTTNVEGYEGGEFNGGQVFLDTRITPELLLEGLARDVVRRIQTMRKDLNLDYEQHITVEYDTKSEELAKAIEINANLIKAETQADELVNTTISKLDDKFAKEWEINDVKGVSHVVKLKIAPQ